MLFSEFILPYFIPFILPFILHTEFRIHSYYSEFIIYYTTYNKMRIRISAEKCNYNSNLV